jgi:hypothetical protein
VRAAVLATIALTGAALLAVPATVAARPSAVLPKPVQPAACTVQPPKLLDAGTAPRTRLRLDLRNIASISSHNLEVEAYKSVTLLPDATTRASQSTRTVASTWRTRPITADGHLPFAGSATIHYSGPSAGTGTPSSVTIHGFYDALNGGAFGGDANGKGGSPINDHLPSQAIGVGARWQVVNCDAIYDTPARETRTYTLVSVEQGVVMTRYRDVIAIDPGHVDLGTQVSGKTKVHVQLLQLSGTATGTQRVPLSNGFHERDHTVSKVSFTVRATGDDGGTLLFHTRVVDTDTTGPRS